MYDNGIGYDGMQMGYDEMNQGYNNGMNGMPYGQQRVRKPGKQEIINWFKQSMGCTELDLVDDCSDECARHICLNGNSVELLPKQCYNINTPDGGVVVLEYYRCSKCGKIILNRNFM